MGELARARTQGKAGQRPHLPGSEKSPLSSYLILRSNFCSRFPSCSYPNKKWVKPGKGTKWGMQQSRAQMQKSSIAVNASGEKDFNSPPGLDWCQPMTPFLVRTLFTTTLNNVCQFEWGGQKGRKKNQGILPHFCAGFLTQASSYKVDVRSAADFLGASYFDFFATCGVVKENEASLIRPAKAFAKATKTILAPTQKKWCFGRWNSFTSPAFLCVNRAKPECQTESPSMFKPPQGAADEPATFAQNGLGEGLKQHCLSIHVVGTCVHSLDSGLNSFVWDNKRISRRSRSVPRCQKGHFQVSWATLPDLSATPCFHIEILSTWICEQKVSSKCDTT